MKFKSFIAACAAVVFAFNVMIAGSPKREFRGAWMHTVFQDGYKKRSTEENKEWLRNQLDSLRAMGINAILFQVRPQADAFYASSLEPWSCYLTDGGKAPEPFWDPLQFMIEESHARGMELHAWLNPYRVTSNTRQIDALPASHIYRKHPERFLKYADGKLYFDPALPENRQFIVDVVSDIVSRYDVDGIHFDDYFYPYPVKGKEFPDDKSYAKYGNGMDRGDWRRKNVDMLIEQVSGAISELKPWVRFGISPFGIYRNKSSHPDGSDTAGLENYDALYADVLLWEREGWIDYLLPQLYWEMEHKAASYTVLLDWWNRYAGSNRHLYIGQDVARTMQKADLPPSSDKSQLRTKVAMTRRADNVHGNCWWPGYDLTRNVGGVADSLIADLQASPALVPASTWKSSSRPEAVSKICLGGDNSFSWSAPVHTGVCTDVVKYAVYRFDSRADVNIEAEGALVAVTPETSFAATRPGVYVVTAIDRVNNESAPSAPIVIK